MHFFIDRTVHTTAFDKPVVDHWLERRIPRERSRQQGLPFQNNVPPRTAKELGKRYRPTDINFKKGYNHRRISGP